MDRRRRDLQTPHKPADGGGAAAAAPAGAQARAQPRAAGGLRIGLPTPHKLAAANDYAAELEQHVGQAGRPGARADGERSPAIVRSPRRVGGPSIIGEIKAGPVRAAAAASAAANPPATPEPAARDDQPPALPAVGSVLACIRPAKVRAACGLLSELVGYTMAGEDIVVRSAVLNEYGQARVQFERGWTSVCAGDGTPLLRPTTAHRPAAPAAASGGVRVGDWCKVLARSIYRLSCAMDSEELGVLNPGELIKVLEIDRTAHGKERVRFDRGWTSTSGTIGPLLEVQNLGGGIPSTPDRRPAQPAAAPPASPAASMNGSVAAAPNPASTPAVGARYCCVKKSVIRAEFDLRSEFCGHLQVNEIIEALDSRVNSWGQLRIHFERGWVSVTAGDGGVLLTELASGGAPVKVEQNELFDDASPADEGEDVPTAAPAEIHGLKVEVSDAVARLPPESPEKKFATHLVAQAESSARQNEWEKAQRLYVRALQKCGIQALATPGSDYDLDELVAGAAAEDADNPLFGDDEVEGLIQRLEPTEFEAPATVKVVRSEKQTREDLQMWFDLKPLPWGKQMKELTPAGWTEPSPEYDDMDSQLGRRLFVLEHGFGTLVKCNRKKRSWGPCAVDFVDGGKKSVILRLKGREMGTPFLISPEVAEEVAEVEENELFGDDEVEGVVERSYSEAVRELNPEQEQRDKEQWASLKARGWGAQMKQLAEQGWQEPSPDYDKIDTQIFRRLFVLEHGFGTLVKVNETKRGWGPCAIDFVDGGKKTLILRLKGKEMGTPFLINPHRDAAVSRVEVHDPPSNVQDLDVQKMSNRSGAKIRSAPIGPVLGTSTLTSLNISRCDLGAHLSKCIQGIAEMSPTLTSLDVSHNGATGLIPALCDKLKGNRSLTALKLCGNNTDFEGVQALRKFFGGVNSQSGVMWGNKSLVALDVPSKGFEEDVKHFLPSCFALPVSLTLESITIAGPSDHGGLPGKGAAGPARHGARPVRHQVRLQTQSPPPESGPEGGGHPAEGCGQEGHRFRTEGHGKAQDLDRGDRPDGAAKPEHHEPEGAAQGRRRCWQSRRQAGSQDRASALQVSDHGRDQAGEAPCGVGCCDGQG